MVVPSHFDCHKNAAGIEFLAPVTLQNTGAMRRCVRSRRWTGGEGVTCGAKVRNIVDALPTENWVWKGKRENTTKKATRE